MMWRRLAQFFVVTVVVSSGVSAAAQGGDSERDATDAEAQRAQEAFERGAALYEQERYAEAVVQFKKGYELVPNPVILYNIGNAQVRMGNYRDAAETAERALAAEALQSEARTKARALDRSSRVLLDAQGVAERYGAGEGADDPSSGEATSEIAPDRERSDRRPPTRDSRASGVGTLGWAGIGTAGAGAGGIVASLVVAQNISSDLDRLDALENKPGARDRFESKRSSVQSKQTTAKVLLFGGAGLGALGATLLTVDLLQEPSDRSAPKTTAGLGPDGSLFLTVEW